jgi:hypothetical protein
VTPEQRLKEAETAYHALLTGRSLRVFVDQNGERVEYTAAKRGDLYNYIQQLKTALLGTAAANTPRPLRFLF